MLEKVCLGNNEELLDIYLSLPKEKRDQRFADTAITADLIGRSQRTIQLWIENGAIKAIPIGGKFKVDLESLKQYLAANVNRRII